MWSMDEGREKGTSGENGSALCAAPAHLAQSPRGCTSISRGCYRPRRVLRLGCTEHELRLKAVFRSSGVVIYPPVTVVFLLLLAFFPSSRRSSSRREQTGQGEKGRAFTPAASRSQQSNRPLGWVRDCPSSHTTPLSPRRVFWKRKSQICCCTMP